ncbi:MAG: sugar phosphate isomerase/epimerase family protein [Paracoccus hibiscisoli]|uniref:sugar phosphate isomerase/epimerase family protein n=1 Tax=Paracoccus hibiscisoli TaxID=2023261 RepID=UPI00391884B9
MRVHAASVAFRHQQVTAAGLADYVARHGFDGLEIWAPHAQALRAAWAALDRRPRVPMLAGYLPVGTPAFDIAQARALVDLTGQWRAPCLRLFAGAIGAAQADADQRRAIAADLRRVADLAQALGLRLAIETHPGTLADSPATAQTLLDALDHPAIGLNFDVLHIWEAGADPLAALHRLRPHVLHLHLKSVTDRAALSVFAPANVHDPAGRRRGMCPLLQGAPDYRRFLTGIPSGLEGSLEWFGPDPAARMAADLVGIRTCQRQALPALG